ncbi:8475_t:CDS:2, partial [Racocetra persica]
LNRMVSGGYRHLPLLDDSDDIIGLLDITECLFHALARLEKAHASTKQLFAVLEDVSDINSLNKADFSTMAALIKQHLCFPRLSSIIDPSKPPPEVSIRTCVRDAARIMKDHHQTAVLVVDDNNHNKTLGIFTTKDIVTRVYGQGVEPNNTSIVRVMTPCPDMVTTDTTILQALRQMQDERYQHLPVINGKKIIVGMVDVLQLTYSTLNTLRTLNGEQVEGGPVWNKFWNTLTPEDPKSEGSSDPPMNETFHSANSIDLPIIKQRPHSSILTPPSSESVFSRRNSNYYKLDDGQFIYKCKYDGSEQSHRFTSNTPSFTELSKLVRSKMNISENADIAISYIDEENDKVILSSDEDMAIAMEIAKSQSQKSPLIRLCVEVKSGELKVPRSVGNGKIPSTNITTESQFPISESTAVTIGGFLSIGVAIGVGVMWAAKSK